MPSSGSAIYRGYLRGWYSPDGFAAVYPIASDVEVTVDFGTQRASLQLVNLRIDEILSPGAEPSGQLTVGSTNALPFVTPANTALGPILHGSAAGYAGLRFFGPLSNGMPPELAGSLSIKGLSGISAIGGFIARHVSP